MNIGIFTDSYKPSISGVVTSIIMLREGLEALGHTVYIIATTNSNVKVETDPYVIRMKGVPFPFKSLREYRIVLFAGRNIKALKALNLDIIHIHTEFTIGQLGLKMQKKCGIPLVYTMHTLYEDYLHHISPFLVKHFKEESVQIIRNEARIIVERADATFLPSNKIKNLATEKIHAKGNIYVVPTGLDLEPFNKDRFKKEDVVELRRNLGINDDEFVLLSIGRIAPEKDLVFLLDGFIEFKRNSPNAKFLIVGGGVYMDELKEEIEKRNLNDSVILTGFVPWEKIGLYYQIGDCFVNASTTETQGLTFIEAFAASQIVVARPDEAIVDLVKNDYNGFLFNDINEFVDILNRIKEDESLRNRIRKNALKSAKPFSKEEYAKTAAKIYEEVVAKKKKN